MKVTTTPRDYQSPQPSDWCPGCGDFAILKALQRAFAALSLPPDRIAVFGGIGCSGKTPYYLSTNGIHTLHGRALPFAIGAKLGDPGLTVVAVGGDGDGLGIGAAHLVNSARHNFDLLYILFDNGVYGLTKGQPAPTLDRGQQTRSMPRPTDAGRLNPLTLALAAGYTWIGRGYAYAVDELAELIRQALLHPGLAFLDVLQPCPTYNDLQTREWYEAKDPGDGRPRLYNLRDSEHVALIPAGATTEEAATRRSACFARALEWDRHIPLGVFLQDLATPPAPLTVAHAERVAPARRAVADGEGVTLTNLDHCGAEFAVQRSPGQAGDEHGQQS